MGIARNWIGLNTSPTEGQKDILEIGWQAVMVKRTNDDNRNVGITAELDEDTIIFEIKARIDPLSGNEETKYWVGLVEAHILPMVKRNDHWLTQKPNKEVQQYRVVSINADEILLEKVL